jgi:hypothetical protein
MSKFGWVLGGVEELSFKRAHDGWLFTSPTVWPRRTYLLTDAQKANLVGPLHRMLAVQLVLIFVTVFGAMTLAENYETLNRWLVFGIAPVAVTFLSWLYWALAIRPLVAGLAPTDERITFSDRFKRQATIFPKGFIIIMLLGSLVLFAAGVAVLLHGALDLMEVAGIVFFGMLSVYWIALFVAKQRTKAQS